MKQGGIHTDSGGFTMVETLLVLAVTGLLFVSTMVLISGRQSRTQFATSINNLQQQLQQIINETATGYYPQRNNFTCNAGSPVTFTAVAHNQGENSGCIFLGKVVQFGLGPTGAPQSSLGVLALAGTQNIPGTTDPTETIAGANGAKPVAIPYSATQEQMRNGLTVAASNGATCSTGICYILPDGTIQTAGAIAFVAGDSLGNLTKSDADGLQAGSQQVSLYGVKASRKNMPLTDTAQRVGNTATFSLSGLEHAQSASICIASATTDQSGLLTINDGLNVKLEIRSGLTC